jgi:hypothetical protein
LNLFGPGLNPEDYKADSPEAVSDLLGRIARKVVERDMTVPAIMLLETVKPLSFLGSQALVFLNPIVSLIVSSEDYYRFVRLLDDRENIEKLEIAIEEENARETARRREARARKPGRRRLFRFGKSREVNEMKGDGSGREGDQEHPGD